MVPGQPHASHPAILVDLLLGAILLAGAAGGLRIGLGLPAGVLPLSLVAYAVLALLLWRQRAGRALTQADRVTLGRATLVMLLIGVLPGAEVMAADPAPIFAFALAAALLDGVDGAVARRLRCETQAGARFDMEVDAVLLAVLAIWVYALDRAGLWVILIGLWRYLFVLAGWVQPALARPLPASQRRRVICGIQAVGLALCTAPGLPVTVATPTALALLLLVSYSFIIDAVTLWRNPNQGEQ